MKRSFLMTLILCSLVITSLAMTTDWFLSPAFAQPDPSSPNPDRSSGKNRDASGATQIRLGGADEDGSISYDEGDRTDWYKVKVELDGRLKLVVKNRIKGDLNLEAYGPDATTRLAESLTPGTGDEKVSFPVNANTWYYAKVYAHQPGDAGKYVISNTFYDDLTPPQIILPQSEWTTTEDTVIIPGTVKDNDAIAAIRINGREMLSSTTALSPSSGEALAFSYPVRNLMYGENFVEIEAEDAAGNPASPVQVLITRPDPPPTITITAPEEGTWITEAQVVIRGAVQDNTQVRRLYINDKDISDTVSNIGENQVRFAYTLKELPYGESEVTVQAEDDHGQTNREIFAVYRDAPPEITITSPRDGVSTKDTVIPFQGRVTDDRKIARLVINGIDISAQCLPSGEETQCEFAYEISDLSYGENTITVEAKDDSNNESTQTLTVYREEVPPAIVIHTPRENATISEEPVLVEGTVSDADGIEVVRVNGVRIQVDPFGAFQYHLSNLPPGPHDIIVTATDRRDKQANKIIHITTIDETPPEITILRPEDGAKITGDMVVVEVAVRDNDQIKQITINGEEQGGTETPGEGRLFTHLIEELQQGDNRIEVTAVDVNGNKGRQLITIQSLDPDYNSGGNNEPIGALPLQLGGGTEEVKLSYDAGNRTDWYKLYVSKNGELELILTNKIVGDLNLAVYTTDPTTQLPDQATQPEEALTPGTGNEYLQLLVSENRWYYIKVYAYQQGDAGEYTLQTRFREKDLTPPQILLKHSKFVTQASSFTLEGTIKDNKKLAAVRINGEDIFSSTEVLDEQPGETRRFSHTLEDLMIGDNQVEIQAEDASGNLMEPMHVTITRQDLPPTITITAPKDGARIRESQLEVRGTVKDNESVTRLVINGQDISETPGVRDIGKNQVRFAYTLAEIDYGKYEITVIVENDQGQTSEKTVKVYRDAPPSIVIERPQDGCHTKENAVQVRGEITDDRKITQVRVNGEEVSDRELSVLPEREEQQILSFTTTTDLQYGQNVITVEAKDDIGNVRTVRVRVQREEIRPTIHIRFPQEGEEISQDVVDVEGTVTDADGVEVVTINEEPVKLEASGMFRHQVTNLPYGQREFTVFAVDTRGNEAHVSLKIIRVDPNAPVIEIVRPADGTRINEQEISVTVNIKDNDRIAHIKINGKEQDMEAEPPKSEMSFTEDIKDLKNGENLIQITARDASGNIATKSIRVYKVPPPTIVVSHPEPDTQTVADTLLIEGHIQTEDEVASLQIDGTTVNPDQQNSFSYQVQLPQLGENLVKITATDSLGGEAHERLTLTRLDPDYQSGEDKTADGANHLPLNDSIKEIDINYDGDRTDWFKIRLDTTGELTVKLSNALPGDLDVELYGPDTTMKLEESKTLDTGNETLTVRTDQEGVDYYVKVTAVGLGDRGQYTISTHFLEVDTSPPVLTITEPEGDEVWIDQGGIIITGTAQDNSAIKAVRIVGDRVLPVGGASIKGNTLDFRYTVTRLRQGENIIKIIAEDQAGNTNEKVLHVTVGEKGQPPVICVTSVGTAKILETDETGNISRIETEEESLSIQGIVTSAKRVKDVKVRVEKAEKKGVFPLSSKNQAEQVPFESKVLLNLGVNEVAIEAIDSVGQATKYLLIAERKLPESSEKIGQVLKKLRPGNVYAVVIGIGRYQDERLNLRYTTDDARGFYDVLIDPNYGRVPQDHVQLLLDQEATYHKIKRAIGTWLRKQAKKEDTVLIYYSGHGAPESVETYWVTHQANIDDLYSTALNNNEIADMLGRIPSKRLVVFLDACYSAATVYRKDHTKRLVTGKDLEIIFEKFSGEGRLTISSSDGTQFSLELEEYGHGVFTYYLLEGLRGKADTNLDGVIDVDEIWDYVKYQVTEAARKAGNSQTPKMQGEYTAGIPLTFNVPFLRKRLSEQEFQAKRERIVDLYRSRDLSVEQFTKALEILKSGQEDRLLEDFLAGEISLELFKETF